jgi:hypothetical protein
MIDFIVKNSNLILTSTILSGLVSAIVSAVVSLWLKNLDFKNEYYKKILDKRLEAYSFLERQIAVLKSSSVDELDAKPYHLIFEYSKEKFFEFQNNLIVAMAYGLWINDSTVQSMEKLNDLFFYMLGDIQKEHGSDYTEIGKKHYKEIVKIRNELEENVRKDLLNLYDFKKFDKSKNKGVRILRIEKQ